MMRKTICRTMATSTIHAFALEVVEGKPEAVAIDPVVIVGKASEKEALKAVKEAYGKDKAISIGKIQVDEATYEISVDDFMKHATKIEN